MEKNLLLAFWFLVLNDIEYSFKKKNWVWVFKMKSTMCLDLMKFDLYYHNSDHFEWNWNIVT